MDHAMMKSLSTGFVMTLCLCAAPALSDPAFIDQFQSQLAAANLDGAEALARTALEQDPGDAQARFALGTVQFLEAVEGLGQGLYDHGLQPRNETALGIPSVTSLPFLRMPVTVDPSPQPFTAAVFRQILTDFEARLQEADATLAMMPKRPVSLPLRAQDITLDYNHDGKGSTNETLPTLIYTVSGVSLRSDFPVIGFDESDVTWLRGYMHLLGGITDILLAHDWTETVNQTFQSAFPAAGLPSAPIEAQRSMLEATLQANLAPDGGCYDDRFRWWDMEEQNPAAAEDRARLMRCRAAEEPLWYGGIGDLVAFVHLFRWPVLEPQRLLSARQHFLTMIALSRESWASIKAETDDNAEWVPGPRQTSLFTNMPVTDQTVTGWMSFLDQAEGVLEGRYLIPHWRFDRSQGLNIRRMFEEPRTLDPVLIIAGPGAIPYMETGPLAPDSTMDIAMGLIGGGLLGYFLWFN